MVKNIVLAVFLLVGGANLRAQVIDNFLLKTPPNRNGLVGNSVSDLIWFNGTLYAGTSQGLSATSDEGASWKNWTPADYGGKGGISAMEVTPDGSVWIATGYDTTIQDNSFQIGGGLRFLPAGSDQWQFFPQPIDARSDTTAGMRPTTTRVQNITFDMMVTGNEVWIASWAGGIRRSSNHGQSWQIVTLDGKPFDAASNVNQLGFSLLAENGHIWVGTAGGLGLSLDGGNNFKIFTHTNKPGSIAANWILGLAYNAYDGSVWALTRPALGADEINSVSRTKNDGQSWQTFLADELSDGTFARAIAFYDSAVYIATEKGVYKSIDDGRTWFLFPPARDEVTGETLEGNTFFSVATSPAAGGYHNLWAGSSEGLAVTGNNGFTWTVFRSFISTRVRKEPAVYAYPNPFSPSRDEPVRFQFDIKIAGEVSIEIFNFAMERVIRITRFEAAPDAGSADRSLRWDGRDSNGRMVDNGVYFFRAKINGKVTWGKIVVVN